MNVSLGERFEKYIQEKIRGGRYASASEVIRESLRLMMERDDLYEMRLKEVRGEIQRGIDQAEGGEILDGSAVIREMRAYMDELERKRKG